MLTLKSSHQGEFDQPWRGIDAFVGRHAKGTTRRIHGNPQEETTHWRDRQCGGRGRVVPVSSYWTVFNPKANKKDMRCGTRTARAQLLTPMEGFS